MNINFDILSVLIFLLFINIPIAISIALATVAAMVAKTGPQYLVNTALAMYNGAKSFPLIAIPLFILAGAITLNIVFIVYLPHYILGLLGCWQLGAWMGSLAGKLASRIK